MLKRDEVSLLSARDILFPRSLLSARAIQFSKRLFQDGLEESEQVEDCFAVDYFLFGESHALTNVLSLSKGLQAMAFEKLGSVSASDSPFEGLQS